MIGLDEDVSETIVTDVFSLGSEKGGAVQRSTLPPESCGEIGHKVEPFQAAHETVRSFWVPMHHTERSRSQRSQVNDQGSAVDGGRTVPHRG